MNVNCCVTSVPHHGSFEAFPKAVGGDNSVVAFHVYAIGVQIYHRGELTASIAHEVNQPLAAVVNNPNAVLASCRRALRNSTKFGTR